MQDLKNIFLLKNVISKKYIAYNKKRAYLLATFNYGSYTCIVEIYCGLIVDIVD